MPRLDGVLYNWEKAALKPKPVAEPKPKIKPGRRARLAPAPAIEPRTETEEAVVAVNKGGRPPTVKKLPPEVIDKVIERVRQGLPQESALVLAGISRSTVENWRKRNPLLQIRFEQAESEYEERLLGNMNKFACDDAKANQWLLERRIQGRWAPVTKAELTGKDGAALGLMSVSQQLFASVAGAGDKASQQRKAKSDPIDVTPKP